VSSFRKLQPVDQQRRGLRFLLTAPAEIAPESSPSASVAARVAELSLYGCYLDMPAPFDAQTPVLVKIFNSAEYFEARATVAYVKPALGMGLAFREVKPHFLAILQKWILAAMHKPKET
jgi:PilZ domain-containing protein